MSDRRDKDGNSWLDVVASLLTREPNDRPKRRTRRLAAERLERRLVLSTAAVEAPADYVGESLAEYLAHEHPMGPIAPPPETTAQADAPPDSALDDHAIASPDDVTLGIAPEDYFFAANQGAGEGEGEGEGSGSGDPPTVTGDPIIDENGSTNVSGEISDDGDLEDLTVNYDGPGSFSVDEDGNFVINIGTPEGSGTATITVTDVNGQTTTYSFTYGT